MSSCDLLSKLLPLQGHKQPYRLKTIFEPETIDENYIWKQYIKGGEKRLYTKKSVLSYFEPDTPQNDSLGDSVFPFEVVNILLPAIITENGAKSCVSDEKSLGAPGDVYLVTDTRKKPRKECCELLSFLLPLQGHKQH